MTNRRQPFIINLLQMLSTVIRVSVLYGRHGMIKESGVLVINYVSSKLEAELHVLYRSKV